MPPDQYVFKHCEVFKQPDILKGSRNAQLRDRVGGFDEHLIEFIGIAALIELFHRTLRMIGYNQLTVKVNRAVRGGINAGYHVKGSGFTSAVRANERDDLAAVNLHRQVVDRHNAAKLHRDIF